MSERSKETVLKTVVGKPTASSNLASSANGVSSNLLETLFVLSIYNNKKRKFMLFVALNRVSNNKKRKIFPFL